MRCWMLLCLEAAVLSTPHSRCTGCSLRGEDVELDVVLKLRGWMVSVCFLSDEIVDGVWMGTNT